MSASEKQVTLVSKLLAEREVPEAITAMVKEALADPAMTPGAFAKRNLIGLLLTCPKNKAAQPKADAPKLATGLYLHNGKVYEVIQGRAHLYAKVLHVASGKFFYSAGAIFELPAGAQPVTIQQALAFGLQHGRCIKGHPLTDHLSIQLGIGPTCCQKIFGVTQAQLAKQQGITKTVALA